jgi:hypothetical protein
MHGRRLTRGERVAGLSQAAYDAPPQDRLERDAAVVEAPTAVAAVHPSWGFWKCFGRPRAQIQLGRRASARRWSRLGRGASGS